MKNISSTRFSPAGIFGITALAFLAVVAVFFGYVLLLAFAGILLAVFFDGISAYLARWTRLPRGATFTLVVTLFLALMGAAALRFGPLFLDGINQLADTIRHYADDISNLASEREWAKALFSEGGSGGSLVTSAFSTAAGLLGTATWVISAGLIILFTGIYLAAEPGVYTGALRSLFPERHREELQQALRTLQSTLHWWLIGRIASMLVVGILTWTGLLVLDVPLAFTLALLAALLSFIPNLGPVLSAVPAGLVGLEQSVTTAIYVIILYVAVQTVESYFITPLIQRRAVRLPPALVITMQVLMAFAYGTLGLLVATPLTVVAVVLVKVIYLPRRNATNAQQEEGA
ncbi:AI-2E family transporter [Thiohalomonas denitrificans]|uniref:Predicted PurR-regulated permease PerM n=1 Tax=Thiohalomonas denitrificans TaxID=415747 RepID=A0A1G5QF33_9GAMM|nr:AI-2E family transporter [Thiohalomonas denitrificans]SCZ60282.1 Predicted PurR-regulated permease PerM [Thiohalomonas denitrificans]